MSKNIIIQCSTKNSASVVLINILHGLLSDLEPVKFIDRYSIKQIKELIDNTDIPILKTHICNLNSWINHFKEYNLIFICSDNNSNKITTNCKNTVIIDNTKLITSESNTPETIIDYVINEIKSLLPANYILNKESCIKRLNNMFLLYNDIKNKPFSYVDTFFHIHGSHNSTEKIIEI
jgi:hypothetical protein